MIIEQAQLLITDPCYVFPSDEWTDLCNRFFCPEDQSPQSGVIYVNPDGSFSGTESEGSVAVPWFSTKYGDGGYDVREHGSSIGKFGVDAGLFAIFTHDVAAKLRTQEEIDRLIRNDLAAKIEAGGEVQYDNGDCFIGDSISIFTSGEPEEDESDEDEDWLEEDEDEEDEDEE